MSDQSHPSYYCFGDIECIDAIEASMSPEEFRGFLKGSVEKYVWRYLQKHDDPEEQLRDLKKARDYLDRLIERMSWSVPSTSPDNIIVTTGTLETK